MPVFRLSENNLLFPPVELAEPDGLLAVGGDLSAERIVAAYRQGIFPWFGAQNEPILWWSPDPRMVLLPNELHISKSMRPLLNRQAFRVSFDTDFEAVIRACAGTPRRGQQLGFAWLGEVMIAAYLELHELGYAHSVEVWNDADELVGGLYGLSMGGCFFGESMFARASNASKYGFIKLVQWLKARDFDLVDCQVHTDHLESLGARLVPRGGFLEKLEQSLGRVSRLGRWET